MDGPRPRFRNPGRTLFAILLVVVPLGVLAARHLEVSTDRVTIGTVVVGAVLVIGALTLPALIFVGWDSDDRSR